MMTLPYRFAVIRYVHSRQASERLNVGVLVYSIEQRRVAIRVETRYQRLSETFAGFHGDEYRRALRTLESAINELQRAWTKTPLLRETPPDAMSLLRGIWPDLGLGLTVDSEGSGITDDVENEANRLFTRLVISQHAVGHDRPRREDQEVWTSFRRALPDAAVQALRRKRFVTPDVEVEFEHAFQNEAWSILHPLSMDFADADTIQRKAAGVVGTAVGLQSASDIGVHYVLLGEPVLQKYRNAFEKAKRLLDKMPGSHELVDERDATEFASKLTAEMKRHGVIKD